MNIKNLFSFGKKSAAPVSPFMSFVNYLAFNGWANLSSFQSLTYYMQVSPLYDAVNKIARECSSIQLYMYDLNKEEYSKKHQFLDLMRHPNTDVGSHEFMEQLICYFLVTGNCYVIATGQPNRPPLELFIAPPQYITLEPDPNDGYTGAILYTSSRNNVRFSREEVNGRFRYYSPDKKQEIYHIRVFNPFRGVTVNYGLSPLSPIYYEIEQYIKAGVHNLSLLARGARPSGALTTPETLTDAAFARLQEQLDRFNSGAENAGRPILLQNGLQFVEMGTSNKDMDFERLKQGLKVQIYNAFNIPLALISEASMSYNNLETARLSLYDFAVLPTLGRILEELSNFLMYRYGLEDKAEISYNKDSIPALQLRRNEELTLVKNLGVNSINEIRAMRGDDPVIGGDNIYSTGAMFPVARTTSAIDQDELDEDNALASGIQEPVKLMHLDYQNMMRKVRRVDGQPLFSEPQLNELAKQYGITR